MSSTDDITARYPRPLLDRVEAVINESRDDFMQLSRQESAALLEERLKPLITGLTDDQLKELVGYGLFVTR